MTQRISTTCAIVGGGPAGMMLGVLLARAGVDVVVMEKHGDFLRDFRGDTIHPSTLELIAELGWLDAFLERPHQEVRELSGQIGADSVTIADFRHLPTRCRYIALMPQWDFLDFLAGKGKSYPGFTLLMQTEVTALKRSDGRVTGVIAKGKDGTVEIDATLVVAADGRDSHLRDQAGLPVDDLGAPMDVFWMRLPRRTGDPHDVFGRVAAGHIMVMIDRGDYWQCALAFAKGRAEQIRVAGLPAFHRLICTVSPFLADRVAELDDWDKVKLLTVTLTRASRWHQPGLLLIGDAAHAMSPIGGVGINLAVQDAVAAANALAEPLRRGTVDERDLARVQSRRMLPTRATQAMQRAIQNRIIGRVLGSTETPKLPVVLKLFNLFPVLRRIPGRIIGLGFRPEHVRSPQAAPTPPA